MLNYSVVRSKVALRSTNGRYVCAEQGGGGEVNVTRTDCGIWETFELLELEQPNMVALRSHDGHYVCAEGGGGGDVVANRDELLAWETFELVGAGRSDHGRPLVGLRAANGLFVCAEGGGGHALTATRQELLAWETFELVGLGDRVTAAFGTEPLTTAKTSVLGKAATEPQQEQEGDYLCEVKPTVFSFAPRQPDRFMATSIMSDILWPGMIIDASTVHTGEYSPVIAERAPLELSHTIPGVPTSFVVDHPSLSSYRQALETLIAGLPTAQTPAQWEYMEQLVSSEEQLQVAVGGHYKKGSLDVSADFDFSSKSVKSKLVTTVSHIYFTIDVPPNFEAEEFFLEDRSIGDEEVYFATVTYGHRLTFVMESYESGHDLAAAASVATSKGGGDVSVKHRRLLNQANINVWEEGGTGGGAVKITNGADGIRDYIDRGAHFGPGVRFAPLFFKMRQVKNPHPITYLSLLNEVSVRTCERVNGTFRVKDGKVRRRTGTGRQYRGTITAQAFDADGRPNVNDPEPKRVWHLARSEPVSLDKDKWVTTGAARQELSWTHNLKDVKGTAYIEFDGDVYEWDKRSGGEKLKGGKKRIYLDDGSPQTVKMRFEGPRTAPLEFQCTVEALH